MSFSQPQAASADAAPTRRLRWLGSTALLASLAMTVTPSEAWAACSGINTDTTVCDAANPSGGSLDTTTNSPGATVDINAGAGVNTGVALGAAAHVVVQDDLIFTLTDPAGISSTVANSNAIFLEANIPATGKITYNGSSNVTSAATGIRVIPGAGGVAITQSAGVVTGAGNAIEVSADFAQFDIGNVAVSTVGSQINGNISVLGNSAITITTGAVSGGIIVDEFGASGMGAVLITTNGAITNLSGKAIDVHSMSLSPITGSITLIANAAITGDIDLTQTRASATGPVTMTLNQSVTSNMTVANAGSGATTVSTQGIDGSLSVLSRGHLNTAVNGNINAVGVSSEGFGASITGPGDMNVAIKGAISATGSDVAASGAVGAFVSSGGISASGNTRVFNASGDVTAVATATGAAGSSVAMGGGASSNGSVTLEATFGGAISATAIASGAGATANATAVTTGVGGNGNVNLLLNGPLTAIASANNAGTASAVGIQAFFQGGGSGNLNVTANDTLSAKASDGNGQAIGIFALDLNNVPSTAAMTFIAKKDVSAVGSIGAFGIIASQGLSGLGSVSLDVMGSVRATAPGGAANGIVGSITNAANTSALAIRIGGDVIASGLAGQGSGITASSAGTGDIAIDVAGAVRSAGPGISASRTAAGNIFISADSVTGTTGVTTSGGTATVVIGSSVTGTDGIAVQLGGTNDTLRLLGTNITGSVTGTGTSVLQLGGAKSAKFDSSLLGFANVTSFVGSSWSLNASSSFAGPFDVGGMLAVNGLIPNAAVTVGSGGTLGGNGTVGNTLVGGTLAPGNSIGTLTVSGSLTFTAAATYLVQISGTTSDRTNVTGSATLAGKVTVDPLTHLGQTTTYTIINAGVRIGTFDSATLTNNFARNARLSYVGNDVLLTLDPGLLSPILPGNASGNQKNVAAAIDNALIGGATLPAGFNGLFNLSGNGLLNVLTQVSGETATGAQQTTFDSMNLFMGLLTDPFTAGRSFEAPGAIGYENADPRNAHAMFTKAMPRPGAFEAHWNVWAAGYGGSRTTDGNFLPGSNNATASIGGVAVGTDYWLSPNTVAGFALAGGGTSFSVANGGSGRSDLFQAGAFVRHNVSSGYVTAAMAYGWQDITTDRNVTISGIDRLHANYTGNAFSARIEGGNRYLLPWMSGIGVTPYAAAQVTALDLPGYAETVNGGVNTFALSYTSKTVTAPRSELGLRSDKSFAISDAILTLRGRAAWAHDYSTERSAQATFQTLPGASFSVSGAAAAHDTALTTASAEMKFSSGISLAATFEGEFSGNTRSYAGKGVARYNW